MKRRMRNRTFGVVGGGGLYPATYPITLAIHAVRAEHDGLFVNITETFD